METTLHRQLKRRYCDAASQQEVDVDGYRIDAVAGDWLVEIQTGTLAAIRAKVRELLIRHHVLVVKPLVMRKLLVKRNRSGGPVIDSRYSPSRGSLFDVFADLVYFVDVFPHPRLAIDVILTEQEEHRVVRRQSRKGYRVDDRVLGAVVERIRLAAAEDLLELLPPRLLMLAAAGPISTQDMARETGVPRWLAQKLAYCLRKTGAAQTVGKQGNSLLYTLRLERKRAA